MVPAPPGGRLPRASISHLIRPGVHRTLANSASLSFVVVISAPVKGASDELSRSSAKVPDSRRLAGGELTVVTVHRIVEECIVLDIYSDLQVKRLCKEWFPIDYPDAWYNDITSSAKFFSVACVLHGRIIGLVVAEIRDFGKLPKEDSELLAATFGPSTKVAYVLSLGVVRELRNNGVASLLLGNLISHLTSDGGGGYEDSAVRAVYLHVLTTNSQAISFYENRGFSPHLFLPYYYNIKGRRRDGFTYVRYLNGGHPPWGLLEYAAHWCRVAATLAMNPWAGARKVVGGLAWQGLVPRVRQIAQSSTAMFS